jgi:ParB family chromosome partitioning protein
VDHHLKTDEKVFILVSNGLKTFEFRKNDRNFDKGDTLILQKWDFKNNEFYGPRIVFYVPFVLYGGEYGVPEGYCIMSLKRVN